MSLRTACTLLFAVCSLGAAAPIRAAGEKSPAQDRVDAARRAIEKEPTRPGPHNALALALARRARETGDASLYDEAQKAIDESLRLAPENYDALKTRVWLLLGKHEFSKSAPRPLESSSGERRTTCSCTGS
jgi:Flp pilus assembly protein TadD